MVVENLNYKASLSSGAFFVGGGEISLPLAYSHPCDCKISIADSSMIFSVMGFKLIYLLRYSTTQLGVAVAVFDTTSMPFLISATMVAVCVLSKI